MGPGVRELKLAEKAGRLELHPQSGTRRNGPPEDRLGLLELQNSQDKAHTSSLEAVQ